jgi:vacuolar-type H+-ATPase subunit C/Vma6
MNFMRTYGLVNAKIRARRSGFLDESTLRTMASAKDLAELLSQLGKTRLREWAEEQIHSDYGKLETALWREELRHLEVLRKDCKGNAAKMLEAIFHRYEAERFKAFLRQWQKDKNRVEIIRDSIQYVFDWDRLVASESIEDLAKASGPFQEPIESVLEEYKTRGLFIVELAIDKDVFARFEKTIASLGAFDRKIANRLLGAEADLKNLEWIGRFRKYYQIPAAEAASYLLPMGYRLKPREIQEAVSGGSIQSALERITHGVSSTYKKGEWTTESLERFLMQTQASLGRWAFAEFPLSVGSILGYAAQLKIEFMNLRMLMFAKYYKLPSQEAESLLVL